METTLTCIYCPVGCRLKVTLESGAVTQVAEYGCKRGKDYAQQEMTAPTRMVTALVRVKNRQMPLSVKTEKPIPKEMVFQCVEQINKAEIYPPVRMGQVICENVCGTGVNVIATKEV